MLSIERESKILELLKSKEIIKLKEIVDSLKISEATARRDLATLEEKDLIKRVHGGAILNFPIDTTKDFNIQYRESINSDEKEIIAKYAAKLIKENSVIYLDAGTTTRHMIKYLKKLNVKVITNGLNLISELEKYKIETILIGGKVKNKTSCTTGFSAVKYLKTFNFDYVFIGANGFSLNGYSTPDSDEAIIKNGAVEQGKKIYFLCDNSKEGKESLTIFSTIDQGVLITDKPLPMVYKDKLKVEVAK